MIAETRTTNAADLLHAVRSAGNRLQAATKTGESLAVLHVTPRLLLVTFAQLNTTFSSMLVLQSTQSETW